METVTRRSRASISRYFRAPRLFGDVRLRSIDHFGTRPEMKPNPSTESIVAAHPVRQLGHGEKLRVIADSLVDKSTLERFLAGRPVRHASRERILAALKLRGLIEASAR
jgi:hypothetical protein